MLLFLLVCYLVYLPTDWHLLIGDKCDNDYGRQKKSCSINTNIFFSRLLFNFISNKTIDCNDPTINRRFLLDTSQMYYLNANGKCLV